MESTTATASPISRRSFAKAAGIMLGTVAGATGLAGIAQANEASAQNAAPSFKVRAAVFSAAGGTMAAALAVADALSDDVEIIDQTSLASRQEEIAFAADELAIMACPSYAGKIPHAPGLFTNLKGDGTPCVLVAAYGNRACENNFAQMNQIATENGFVVIGAISIVTPHVFGARSGRNRPDQADRAAIAAFAEEIAAKMAAGSYEPIAVEGNPELGDKYESPYEKLWDAEVCQHCGVCVEQCPTGAIDPDTLEIDPEPCIHCQHCTYVCPFGARSYAAAWDETDTKYFRPRNEVAFVL